MIVTVMNSTQRYGELVADLEPHRAGLGEPQMVGVGGASSTDQTGLRGDELKVGFVAKATRLANRKHTFVDLPGSVVVNVCRSRRELLIGRTRDGRGCAGLPGRGLGFAGATLLPLRLSGRR